MARPAAASFGRWQSVYDRVGRWRRDSTFARVAKALRIRLDQQGKIDWDLWCIDGPSVCAARSGAGASKGVRTNRERLPSEAAGDNGYSYPRVRLWMARRGVHPVIPATRRPGHARRRPRSCAGWTIVPGPSGRPILRWCCALPVDRPAGCGASSSWSALSAGLPIGCIGNSCTDPVDRRPGAVNAIIGPREWYLLSIPHLHQANERPLAARLARLSVIAANQRPSLMGQWPSQAMVRQAKTFEAASAGSVGSYAFGSSWITFDPFRSSLSSVMMCS